MTAAVSQSIWIASDHAGFDLKNYLTRVLPLALPGTTINDLGPNSDTRCDYPDFAKKLSETLQLHSDRLGILVCGTGIGMAIAANRFPWIRASTVENPVSARLTREHNHCNVLCLGSRILAPEYAAEIVRTWFEAVPSQDPRHIKRIVQMSAG